MTTPIALQLYTVRDALGQDFEGTIRRVAAMGYRAVETAGFPGTTPQAAAKLFNELGLQVTSAHSPLPNGPQQDEVLTTLAALNCNRLVCPYIPPDQFTSSESIKRVCETLNAAATAAAAHGITLGYHNHDWECRPVDGRPAYQIMREHLDPSVFFEVDTYWAQVAGLDPAAVVTELGPRAPLLHLKDGPAVKNKAMTALGQGVIDIPAILAASQADWLIVELDACDTDMLTAVEESYRYLNGLLAR